MSLPASRVAAYARLPIRTRRPAMAKGELYRNDTTTLLDTREMDWEDFEPGMKVKVLNRFPDGRASVFLLWMPPGGGAGGEAHRHYHKSVDEHHFVLEGMQPTWIYDSAEQGEGEGHN